MEKNELSRIPDSDAVVSPDNPDDPNDPVGTTDDPNDPATDIVVSPDDPNDPVVTTDDPNTCALLTNTLKEIRSTCAFVTNTLKEIRAEQEKVNNDLESSSSSPGSIYGSEVPLSPPLRPLRPCALPPSFNDRPRPSLVNNDSESSFTRTSSIPDPNDPVVTTDDLNDPATDAARRRNKENKKIEKMEYRRSFNDRPRPSQVKWENYSSFNSGEIEIEMEELEKILESIHEPVKQCCIYKVPKDLRKKKEEAYTPQVISIGLFDDCDWELIEMKNQKLRYMFEFHKREGAEKLAEFKRYIQINEKNIRNYYQENSKHKLEGRFFVDKILCDSVFIIEFFLKNANEERKEKKEFDFFLDTACVKAAITRDLQLLENQLPYFLLKNLFEKGAFHKFTKEDYPACDPFLILCHRFFFGDFPKPNNQIQQCEIQHFTDLRRHFLLMDFLPRDQKQGKHVRDLPTATKLHGSGVKFKKGIEGSLEISCEYVPRTMRIPGFKGCEIRIPFIKELRLQIPRFEIDDNSECLYRNMMALELCHYPSETHICNFIVLMDFLINTEKDVDLLVEEEIISNLLGDNATVANMFNNLTLQITPSFSVYHNIGEKLKAHYARPWNRTMANLNNVYFGDIWKGTATVAAVILLVLTFVQTMISILSLF